MSKHRYTHDEATQIVERVQIAAQKARSNSRELMERVSGVVFDDDHVGQAILLDLDKYLQSDDPDTLNIMTVCEKLLDKARRGTLAPIDLYNLLSIAHRSELLELCYVLRWDKDMPDNDIHIMRNDWTEKS